MEEIADAYAEVERKYPQGQRKLKINEVLKNILDHLATDLIENTQREVAKSGVQTVNDIRRQKTRLARFSSEVAAQSAGLKRFLSAHLYSNPAISEDRDRSVGCLEELFKLYDSAPGTMPAPYEEAATKSPRAIVVCDYIAGMTDHFLLRQHLEHFGQPDL